MNEISEIVVSPTLSPPGHLIQVFTDGNDPNEIIILKIDLGYYFPEFDKNNNCFSYQILESDPFINPAVNILISAIRYDYNHEAIVDVQQGFTTLESIDYFDQLSLTPGIETQSKVWRNGALVKNIEGPFQDGKLVTEIDLKKKAYYLASTNLPNVHDSQLLSIKWEYQYNDGEYAKFKNSKRSVVKDGNIRKCKIECGFHDRDDVSTISMFAFFNERSLTISKICNTTKKVTGAGSLTVNGGLIWSAKVTPEFEEKVIRICAELYGENRKIEMANGLMGAMAVETSRTFKAHIIEGQNANTLISPEKLKKEDFRKGSKGSKAVGLIQFTQIAIIDLGDYKKEESLDKLLEVKLRYARMGEMKQLDKVKQFLTRKRNKIVVPADIYLNIFAPEGIGKPDSAVLYVSPSDGYNNNKSLDEQGNNNKKIERSDLLKRYYALYKEGENYRRGSSSGKSPVKPPIKPPIQSQEPPQSETKFFADGIITFHTYHDGRIEKHIPKQIHADKKDKYQYVFHDANKGVHNICVVPFFMADKRQNGIKNIKSVPKGYIKTYNYPTGGDAKTAYQYENGDIIVTGTIKYGIRKYPKGSGKVELIQMRDFLDYNKGNINVFYTFSNTQRRYCNPGAYAAFIGALATLNRKDVKSTGMCFSDSTSYPSVSHPNGDSVDTVYYPSLTLEQKKVDALIKFKFEKICRGSIRWYGQLKGQGVKYCDDHDDHLHAGEFDSNNVIIKKET